MHKMSRVRLLQTNGKSENYHESTLCLNKKLCYCRATLRDALVSTNLATIKHSILK